MMLQEEKHLRIRAGRKLVIRIVPLLFALLLFVDRSVRVDCRRQPAGDSPRRNSDGGGDGDDGAVVESCQKQRSCSNKLKVIREAIRRFASTASSSTAIAGLAASATVAAAAMAAASIEREVKETQHAHDESRRALHERSVGDKCDECAPPTGSGSGQVSTAMSSPPASLDEISDVEGAKLISASLGLVSSSIGIVADTVRIIGDTAGGVAGSSIKLVGGAVKTVGTNLACAGTLLEGKNAGVVRRRPLSADVRRKAITGGDDVDGVRRSGLFRSTRTLAGQSVRAVSSLFKGVGDSIVLLGATTESLTSSTAGVAEDAVRVVEDLTYSLSSAFAPTGQQLLPPDVDEGDDEEDAKHDDLSKGNIISFGTKKLHEVLNTEPQLLNSPSEWNASALVVLATVFQSWAGDFFYEAMSGNDGVPSLVPQIIGVMVICYAISLSLLLNGRKKRTPKRVRTLSRLWSILSNSTNGVKHEDCANGSSFQDAFSALPSLSAEHERNLSSRASASVSSQVSKTASNGEGDRAVKSKASSVVKRVKSVAIFPIRVARWLARIWIRVIFSREMALLVVHILLFFYLCLLSQSRSRQISRYAEAKGFRSAIASIGSETPAMTESVAWLNTLLTMLWRVYGREETRIPVRPAYPFVSYALSESNQPMKTCACKMDGRFCECDTVISYGGLEPYISFKIGELLIGALKSSDESRPSDVAYVSLHSLTLGSVPPTIKGVELRGVEDGGQVINLGLDVDVLLDDFSVVLVIKLSSLEYSLMPSTKLSISAVDMHVSLDLALAAIPTYPYISFLNVSFSEIPTCRVRLTPLSDNSGLQGVDLGSLPVISTWVQDAIQAVLSEYVSPRYISIDLANLLSSENSCNDPPRNATSAKPDHIGRAKTTRQYSKKNGRQKAKNKPAASNTGILASPSAATTFEHLSMRREIERMNQFNEQVLSAGKKRTPPPTSAREPTGEHISLDGMDVVVANCGTLPSRIRSIVKDLPLAAIGGAAVAVAAAMHYRNEATET